MKFRKFVDWCNERACDGAWGMNEAMICINAHQYVTESIFGRKKRWETIWPEIEHIVAEVSRRTGSVEMTTTLFDRSRRHSGSSATNARKEEGMLKVAHLCTNCSKVYPECNPEHMFFAGEITGIRNLIKTNQCEQWSIDAVVACDGFFDERDL